MTRARELANLAGVSETALSNRNLIINGAMNVAQRGTSSTSSGNHTCDRWTVNFQAFDQLAVTQSQSTTTPSGFSNSLKVEVTTAETALAADELMYVSYRIEAQDLQHLNYGGSGAKAVTLSFWVRSSLTGKYSVLLYQDDATRSNTKSFNITSADTWEYKTITIDGDTAGTIDNNNGAGLSLYITLAAGANFAGTPHSGWGAYTATDDFSFSDNVEFTAQTGTFYLTGVQLEVGEQATPFEHRSYGEELAACQRYYQQIGGQTPANVLCVGQCTSSTLAQFFIPFIVPVRDDPTCSVSDQTHFRVFNAAVSGIPDTTNMTIAATNAASYGAFRIVATVGSGLSAGNATMLSGSDSDGNAGIIKMDAEL